MEAEYGDNWIGSTANFLNDTGSWLSKQANSWSNSLFGGSREIGNSAQQMTEMTEPLLPPEN